MTVTKYDPLGLWDIVREASLFAQEVHKDQVRNYSKEKYFWHLMEVAMILEGAGCDPEIVAAGFLHDCKEDQGVQHQTLVDQFGERIANLVEEVTDPKVKGNRAFRVQAALEHLAKASPDAQSIKLADIISNVSTVVDQAPDFAHVYVPEKRRALPYLTFGNPKLYARAAETIERAEERLKKSS